MKSYIVVLLGIAVAFVGGVFWSIYSAEAEHAPDGSHLVVDEIQANIWNAGGGYAHATTSIVSGRITRTNMYQVVFRENATGTDELAGIAGGNDGDILILRSFDSAGILVKHEGTEESVTSNRILMAGNKDYQMGAEDMLAVIKDSGPKDRWLEIFRTKRDYREITGALTGGDIIYVTGTPPFFRRLGIGQDGDVLTVVNGVPGWTIP